jgi:hypothetical protein
VDSVPTEGFKDHVTAVLVVLLTEAENCWAWDAERVTDPGESETDTGLRLTVAVADFAGLFLVVAVMVMV